MLRLRSERTRRGWSLTRVCQTTGISPSDLSKVERSIQPAYPVWRRKISDAFGLPESYLFATVNEPEPATELLNDEHLRNVVNA